MVSWLGELPTGGKFARRVPAAREFKVPLSKIYSTSLPREMRFRLGLYHSNERLLNIKTTKAVPYKELLFPVLQ